MTPEKNEARINSPSFHLEKEACDKALDIFKSFTGNNDNLHKAVTEIEGYYPEHLSFLRDLKSLRLKLGLDENAAQNYLTGAIFGFMAVVQEYGKRNETLPRLTSSSHNNYFLSLLRPVDVRGFASSYYQHIQDYAAARSVSVFDAFAHLASTEDKRYFAVTAQTRFKEGSNDKLAKFKKDEIHIDNAINTLFAPDVDEKEKEGFYLGLMDSVMPFKCKRDDELIGSLLEGININLKAN